MDIKILSSGIILFLSIFGLNMQQDSYDYPSAWKEVDSLIERQLPESALEKVLEIQKVAQKENNDLQVTKSIFYQGKIILSTKENGVEIVIDLYEKEILKSKTPYKEILQSNLAGFYLEYFNNNRYIISQRTEIASEEDADVRTMSAQSFIEKINNLYLASVQAYKSLNVPIENFDPIIVDGYNKEGVLRRPKLYDVLGDKVLSYLRQGDLRPTLPSDKFVMSNVVFFSPKNEFINIKIGSKDNYSTQYQSLLLYQTILKSHTSGSAGDLTTDLNRLEYVKNHYVGPQASNLYLDALIGLAKRGSKNEEYATIAYNIASAYSQLKDYESQLKAVEWCNKGVKAFPKSNGAISCQNLLNSLNLPNLNIVGKEGYPIYQEVRYKVNYKNVNNAYLTLYQIKKEDYIEAITNNNREIEEYISKNNQIRTWQEQLNDTSYIDHTTTLSAQKMENGCYVLRVSNKSEGGLSSYLTFTVSNISIVNIQDIGQGRVILADRISGQPIQNASITFYKQEYDYNIRKSIFSKVSLSTSDENGIAIAPRSERPLKLYIEKGSDYFMPNNQVYSNRINASSNRKATELYTDRGIYRPGQVILFKGLTLSYDDQNTPKIVKDEAVEIALLDANRQEVGKSKYKSNSFGSFDGSFQIPMGALTGSYTLKTSNGQKTIKVEEYKRPTFEVIIDTLRSDLALGNMINVTGKASGLAGNAITNSKVEYEVFRQLYYPRYCYYFPYNQGKEMISTGMTTTDDFGKFKIDFLSKKENTENIRGINYAYTISVNVIDPSGESRQSVKNITLLDTDFRLNITHEEEVDINKETHFTITATNADGAKVDTKGSYTVTSMSKEEEAFTIDEGRYYANTRPYQDWKEGKLVQTGTYSTNQKIDLSHLEAGLYIIKATAKDSKGVEVKDQSYVIVTNRNKSEYPQTGLIFTNLEASYQPGENINALVGTSDPTIHTYYILSRGSKLLKEGWLKVKKNEKVDYRISELDRGGLQLMLVSIKNNKAHTKQVNINVPWTNKELEVTFESFRDKIEPGIKESYNIKIKSKQGQLGEAEILMAMYDASLDQFVSNSWRSTFYPTRYHSMILIPGGFNTQYGYQKRDYSNGNVSEYKDIIYPELMGFENLRNRMYYADEAMDTGGGRIRKSAPRPAQSRAKSEEIELEMSNVADLTSTAAGVSSEEDNSVNNDTPQGPVSPRVNLNETVFFYPTIYTNENGDATVSFTMNDALTRWKLMTLAHTSELKTGYDERYLTTSKDIMIMPNSPRFIRLGDEVWFTARVANMTSIDKPYQSMLVLQDDIKKQNLSTLITDQENVRGSIKANQTIGVAWKLNVPEDANIDLIRYIVSVAADNKTDAEQNYLPVLSNKFAVIETQTICVNGRESKTITFDPLKNSKTKDRINKSYTIEYTSNPVWFAIQALPYLKSSSNPSTTNLINQFFSNTLGQDIIRKYPQIEQTFNTWKTQGSDALKSSLTKNEELKNMLLTETPWVIDAINEQDQKASIARFFDKNLLTNELSNIIRKIKERQTTNGGYSWIPGGRDNLQITLYVLETIGKLDHLKINHEFDANYTKRALKYVDDRLQERYNKLKNSSTNLEKYSPSFYDIYAINIRSYFNNIAIEESSTESYDFYNKQASKYWNDLDIYGQALLGQYFYRKENQVYQSIQASMLERSLYTKELGRYWNSGNGYNWNQMPIERHSAILDFFVEINAKNTIIDELKIWLIKNKQVNNWKTNKATASAVYALLEKGSRTQEKLSDENKVTVTVGGTNITANLTAEKGTGYIKKTYNSEQIEEYLKTVTIDNKADHISWGGLYYQYLDNASNIEGNSNGPLKIKKEIYKILKSGKGEQLIPIDENSNLSPGNEIVSRMIIISDRDMEYIDIKDMRGAGVEPSNTLSKYYWKGGLSYYHSIRDLSDNYFIEYLPKGTHIFEQRQRVVHRGTYSSGLATIQSSYAPEFASNSRGFTLIVK